MKKYFKLYGIFVRVAFRIQMAYRSTYFAGIVGQWLGYGATFATLFIMVSSFDTLSGWNGNEVLLLYGFSVLSYSVGAAFFFTPSVNLSGKIRTGEFDASLTKPLHPFVHEMLSGFNVGYISHFTLSVAVIIIALVNLRFEVTFVSLIHLVLMVLGAALIQAASLIASSVMSFFTINENPILDFLLFNTKQFINYPITVYPRGIQFILTFILPFAFINFYPASLLLGKGVPSGFPAVLPYLTPLVGVVCFALSVALWNWGLKHYKSTGS
ncbi:MAG TPA: ABC-2 family transporter protein [Candidatus Merdibacter merdigallinarum]|nr:ABC-2 family transporter protein [Candidatus Merdibacter merdigallinarum]